jgi:hypothetical protein
MSAYRIAYAMLFLLSLGFGIVPFFGDFKQLARMRIALHMVGLFLFCGAALGVALHFVALGLSPVAYRFLWAHELLLFGMGFGILLLLVFTGDMFATLNHLYRARKERQVVSHEAHDNDQV